MCRVFVLAACLLAGASANTAMHGGRALSDNGAADAEARKLWGINLLPHGGRALSDNGAADAEAHRKLGSRTL